MTFYSLWDIKTWPRVPSKPRNRTNEQRIQTTESSFPGFMSERKALDKSK